MASSSPQGRLPTGFREVQWLQGSNVQYSDTGIYPVSNVSNYTSIKGDVTILNKTTGAFDIKTTWMEGGSLQTYGCYFHQAQQLPSGTYIQNFAFEFGAGNAYRIDQNLSNSVYPLDIHFELNKIQAILNGTTFSKGASHWTATKPLVIGGYYNYSDGDINIICNNVRFKEIYVYNLNTLVYELVPCYRSHDGKTGFMKIDVASGTTEFCPNLGTSEWIIGPVV